MSDTSSEQFIRMLDHYSHSSSAEQEPTEIPQPEKDLFATIYTDFIERFNRSPSS